MGLGTLGGFKLQMEDRGDLGYEALYKADARRSRRRPRKTPELAGVFSSYPDQRAAARCRLDRAKAKQLGVPVTDVFETMQVYLGSLYVNDFNKFGRTYQVRVQADAPFRSHADDIGQLKTRNAAGEMVPLSSLLTVTPTLRSGNGDALQRLSCRRHQRRPRPGLLLRPGASRG